MTPVGAPEHSGQRMPTGPKLMQSVQIGRPQSEQKIVDLAVFYERNNLLLNPDTGFVPATIFATITEGLDRMAEAAQDLWLSGVIGESLTFKRA